MSERGVGVGGGYQSEGWNKMGVKSKIMYAKYACVDFIFK